MSFTACSGVLELREDLDWKWVVGGRMAVLEIAGGGATSDAVRPRRDGPRGPHVRPLDGGRLGCAGHR